MCFLLRYGICPAQCSAFRDNRRVFNFLPYRLPAIYKAVFCDLSEGGRLNYFHRNQAFDGFKINSQVPEVFHGTFYTDCVVFVGLLIWNGVRFKLHDAKRRSWKGLTSILLEEFPQRFLFLRVGC
jgi:hypothetical protein